MSSPLLPYESRFTFFDRFPTKDCKVETEEDFQKGKLPERSLVPVTDLLGVSVRNDPNGREVGMHDNPLVLTVNNVRYNTAEHCCELGGECYRIPGKPGILDSITYSNTKVPGECYPEGYLRDILERKVGSPFFIPPAVSDHSASGKLRAAYTYMLGDEAELLYPLKRIRVPRFGYHIPRKSETNKMKLRRSPTLDALVLEKATYRDVEINIPRRISDLSIAFSPWDGYVEPMGKHYMFTSSDGHKVLRTNPAIWIRRMIIDIFGVDVGYVNLYRKYNEKTEVAMLDCLWTPYPPDFDIAKLKTLSYYPLLEYLAVLGTWDEYPDHTGYLHYLLDGTYCFRDNEVPMAALDKRVQVVDCTPTAGVDPIKHSFMVQEPGWRVDLRYTQWWREHMYKLGCERGILTDKTARNKSRSTGSTVVAKTA